MNFSQKPAFSLGVTDRSGALWGRCLRVSYAWLDCLNLKSVGTPHSRLGAAAYSGCHIAVLATGKFESRISLHAEAKNLLGMDVLGTSHEDEKRVAYPVPMY